MCDPLTIAGIALSAGSAVANNAAANRQARAQASAMSAERSRQNVLDEESRAVNQQSLGRFDDVEGQQERKTRELADNFSGEANRGADVISAALPSTTSNITIANDEAERERASEFSGQQGEALARMRSFGDLFGGIGRDMARDGSELGMIGGFKRGSQGALPFELEAASMKGQGLRTMADLMGGLGGMGVNAGLSGASLPGFGGGAPRASMAPPPRPANLARLY